MDSISIKDLFKKIQNLDEVTEDYKKKYLEQEFQIQLLEKHIDYLFNNLLDCKQSISNLENGLNLIISFMEEGKEEFDSNSLQS